MPYSDQVDGESARRHVQGLLADGMTISQIQFASGVDRTSIRVLLGDFPNRKQSRQIRAGTAERLLRTVSNRGVSIDGLVPSVGTVRRLRALMAIGYTRRWLAERLGMTQLQFGRAELMRATHAQAVMELYDELSATPGPSSRAREFARYRGWLGPNWWDDDTIDDPLYVPDGIATYRTERSGEEVLIDDVTLPRPVRVELMLDRGLTPSEIAQRLGTPRRYVYRDLLQAQ